MKCTSQWGRIKKGSIRSDQNLRPEQLPNVREDQKKGDSQETRAHHNRQESSAPLLSSSFVELEEEGACS